MQLSLPRTAERRVESVARVLGWTPYELAQRAFADGLAHYEGLARQAQEHEHRRLDAPSHPSHEHEHA